MAAQERGRALLAIANQFETANEGLTLSQKLTRYESMLDLLMYPDAQVILDKVVSSVGDETFYLVPVASASFGGMFVRSLAGNVHTTTQHKQDIDLVLVAKTNVVNPLAIEAQIERVIERDPDRDTRFTTCHNTPDGINGVTVGNYHIQAIPSPEKLHEQLSQINIESMDGSEKLSSLMNDFAICFYRSFPPHENEQARRTILEVLQRLHTTNIDVWEELVRRLPYRLFQPDGGLIKHKYFSPAHHRYALGSPEEDARLRRLSNVQDDSERLIRDIVRDLLASTGD